MNLIVLSDFRIVPLLAAIRLKKSLPNSGIVIANKFIFHVEYANYQPKLYKLIIACFIYLFYDGKIIKDNDDDMILSETDYIGLKSSLHSITEQSNADQKKYPKLHRELFNQAVGSRSIIRYLKFNRPENIYIFNGRTASSFPISKYCFENNIESAYYEYAGHSNGFRLYPGIPPHRVVDLGKYLLRYYRNALLSSTELNDAMDSFISEKMNSIFKRTNSLKNDSTHDIVVFFGSDFEYQCVDLEITGVDYSGIVNFSEKVIRKYGDKRRYTFRFHPNSKSDPGIDDVIDELKVLCDKYGVVYQIFPPTSTIDSHSLISQSNLVVTDLSTISLDSMILGKEVDIFGNTDINFILNSSWFVKFIKNKKHMLAAPFGLTHNFLVFRFNSFESRIARTFYYVDAISNRFFGIMQKHYK